jgi:hypothetical protein
VKVAVRIAKERESDQCPGYNGLSQRDIVMFIYCELLKKLNPNRLSGATMHARHREVLWLPAPLAGWL